MIYILFIFSVISLGLNLWGLYRWWTWKRKPDVDAQEMLHLLTNGGAVLNIRVMDPRDLLLYKGGR